MNTGKHFFSQMSSDRKHLLNNNQDDLLTMGAGASQELKIAAIFKKNNETPAKKINMCESMIEDTPSGNNEE